MNKIISILKEKKSIPLDQFINIALYDKKFGYYMKKNPSNELVELIIIKTPISPKIKPAVLSKLNLSSLAIKANKYVNEGTRDKTKPNSPAGTWGAAKVIAISGIEKAKIPIAEYSFKCGHVIFGFSLKINAINKLIIAAKKPCQNAIANGGTPKSTAIRVAEKKLP